MTRFLLPPPALRKCGNHFGRDDYFVGSAMAEAERLRDYHGLNKNSTILDIGCGVARLLVGLRETRLPFGRYVGLDVEQVAIDWCEANLAARPRIGFCRLDVHNERFNPSGKIKMDKSFRLPFDDNTFSIIYSWAVFAHLRLTDTRTYMREFKRVLAPRGSVFLTAWVEPGVPAEQENPPGYPPRYAGKQPQGALHRVRYSKEAFGKAVTDAGLRVENFAPHSEWNYQASARLVQAPPKKAKKRGCCGGG